MNWLRKFLIFLIIIFALYFSYRIFGIYNKPLVSPINSGNECITDKITEGKISPEGKCVQK